MGISSQTIYSYDGSLLSLSDGSTLDASLINTISGGMPATITDNDGFLTQADDGVAAVSFDDGTVTNAPIDYIGAGSVSTISLLGLTLDTKPVAAFSLAGQVYLIAPEGLPALAGLSVRFSISATSDFALTPFSPCICKDTLIATPSGDRPIQSLRPGDDILTASGETAPLLSLETTRVHAPTRRDMPVLIPRNLLGPGCPAKTLRVSRQHRVVLGKGPHRVLVKAAHLLDVGARIDASPQAFTYFHMLFEHHIMVIANGAEVESLLLAGGTRRAVGPAKWKRLCAAVSQRPMSPYPLQELRRHEVQHRARQIGAFALSR